MGTQEGFLGGIQLAAREQPDPALGLGVPVARLRLGAFAASAAIAGLAGALGVELAQVADRLAGFAERQQAVDKARFDELEQRYR